LPGIHPRVDNERTTWELTKPLTTTIEAFIRSALAVGKKHLMS
jgi:hypothetical protein